MAVIQISKIQVRRGLQENLPPVLDSAEMGWSVDTRKLYIGNGTLVEGAPSIGNTEILTEYTDIVAVVKTYSFKGDESGYTSQTGPSLISPITRTLQHKLDEYVSIKDFGAKGDGLTDDTIAIQRAFNQIYPTIYYNQSAVRRIIHFPAGTYLVTSSIVIPPYAAFAGDGVDGTIIIQLGAFDLFSFADSLGQTGSQFGLLSATAPKNIEISSMTLQNNSDYDVITVDSVTGISFTRVKFIGSTNSPNIVGASTAGIRILDSIAASTTINVQQCTFSKLSYGIYAAGNVQQLVVDNSYFYNLYQGIMATTNGSDAVPVAVRLKANLFDKIAHRGLNFINGSSVVSAFNYYKDVGNNLLGSGNPNAAVIYYEGPNNYSFGDSFDRNEIDNVTYLRIQTATGSVTQSVTTITAAGTLKSTPGSLISLPDNSSGNTGMTLSTNITSAIIDYSAGRTNSYRIGTIKYTQSGGTVIFEDDYSEVGITGTTFGFTTYGGNVSLVYTATSTGANVSLNYQVRRFTSS